MENGFFESMALLNERHEANKKGEYAVPAAVVFTEFFSALQNLPASLISEIESFVPNDSRVVGLDGDKLEDFTPITECFQAIKQSKIEDSKHL